MITIETAESVGDSVIGTTEVEELGIEFLKSDAPAHHALCSELREAVSKVLVVGVDVDAGTKEHGSKFLECFDD